MLRIYDIVVEYEIEPLACTHVDQRIARRWFLQPLCIKLRSGPIAFHDSEVILIIGFHGEAKIIPFWWRGAGVKPPSLTLCAEVL